MWHVLRYGSLYWPSLWPRLASTRKAGAGAEAKRTKLVRAARTPAARLSAAVAPGILSSAWKWCRERGWNAGDNRAVTTRRTDVQGRNSYPDRYGDRRTNDVAFDNGYADGYEKGLEDGQGGRDLNPTRHPWYRSADRNYDTRYGSRYFWFEYFSSMPTCPNEVP